jgi:hypothetical protein
VNQNTPDVGFCSVIAIEITQIRNYDKTNVNAPFWRVIGRHFGRFRTSVALGLGMCLWVLYTTHHKLSLHLHTIVTEA